MGGRTFKAMKAAGASDAAIQARVQLLQFRKEMNDWMKKENDPERAKYQSVFKGEIGSSTTDPLPMLR